MLSEVRRLHGGRIGELRQARSCIDGMRACCQLGDLVLTPEPVGPDPKEVRGHPERIIGEKNLGARLVTPVHRDLRHPIAPPPGHQQYLDIEAEAIHTDAGEEILGDRKSKEFEAALRVLDPGICQPFDQVMKRASDQVPIEFCLNADPTILKRARADGHIRA